MNYYRTRFVLVAIVLLFALGFGATRMAAQADFQSSPNITPEVFLPVIVNSGHGTPGPTFTPTLTPTATPSLTPTPTATPCATLAGVLEADLSLQSGCSYLVTGNLLVSQGVTLNVPGNVAVKFMSEKYLRVDGAIIADGDLGHEVVFTSSDENLRWDGIRITSSSGHSSRIAHAIIEYAGFSESAIPVPALSVEGARPILEEIVFRYNRHPFALHSDFQYSVVITDGITLSGGQVYSNTAYALLGSDNNVINGVEFVTNTLDGGSVLLVCAGSTIVNSRFVDNQGLAIDTIDCGQNQQALTTTIANNVFSGNQGAFLDRDKLASAVIFTNNEVFDNYGLVRNPDSLAPITGMDSAVLLGCKTRANENNIAGNRTKFAASVIPGVQPLEPYCEIDASGNWWGTADSTHMANILYDYYDDFELPKIVFSPIRLAPVPNIGPFP